MTATLETPRTTLRVEPEGPAPVPTLKRGLRSIRTTTYLSLAGAFAAAVATAVFVTAVLAPTSGPIPFVVVGYVSFVGYYAVLVSMDEGKETVRDRLAAVGATTFALLLFSVLAFVIVFAVFRGVKALTHWNFFHEDMTLAGPLQGLDIGGIGHAIVGSLEQLGIALCITVPLGLSCAVFLNEFPGAFARFVRTITEAMTALPSIVAGLFIYATWILTFHHDKSGFAASLAISVMMLPIIIRASDVVIRLVPASLREASYALGTSRWSTVWNVVLPTARSGLTTAIILGAARGIGETSPVLLTAGYNSSYNANPFKGPQVSLPLEIFQRVRSPESVMIQRGFGAAVVLLALVLILFILARVLGGRGPGDLTNRQRRRNARLSAGDAKRFAARAAVIVAVIGLACMVILKPSGSAQASTLSSGGGYVPISGAGSTWSQNALDQWRRNVVQYGINVNYQGTGSSDGRNQFRNDTVDFAVSEIPYGLKDNGVYEPPPTRHFAYMPIVAGGTSFMYNLQIGGHRVTNLRLSGQAIVGIFTGKITRWNDPILKRDNPALSLPALKIVPVVRSDGSGTTAQLTTWLAARYPSQWTAYNHQAGRSTGGVTSFFPVVAGSPFVAQSGSLGVAGFVSQPQNVGTITYVEYSYALNTGFPVAKMLNSAGYYTEPTSSNVAVALLKARIHPDLTQDLSGVYTDTDPRTYPLSSYSYMIIPTAKQGSFTAAKGKTLGAFAYYFLCEGQQQAPILGYSPLPINLVQAGLSQVRRIPGVNVQSIDISKCHNPTFSANGQNTLALHAPYPSLCDKFGVSQCTVGTGGARGTSTPVSGVAPATSSNAAPTANGVPSGTNPVGGAGAGAGTGAGGGAGGGGSSGTNGNTAASNVSSQAMTLADTSAGGDTRTLLIWLGCAILLATAVVPPLLAQRFRGKGSK